MAKSYPYTAVPLKDALGIAEVIYNSAGGQQIARVDLANNLKLRPDSTRLRLLITSSARFGLTTGSYKAQFISPAPRSKLIYSPTEEGQAYSAKVEAFESLPAYIKLLDKYNDVNMPLDNLVINSLMQEFNLTKNEAQNCWSNFRVDLEFLGWITPTQSGPRILKRQPHVSTVTQSIVPSIVNTAQSSTQLPVVSHPPTTGTAISPTIQLNIEIHIAANAEDSTIEAIFKNMQKYLMPNAQNENL
jgi:hypothetical protein